VKPARLPYLPSLHQVLLLVSVIALLLPLGGLHFIKLYENALVRSTESELISQSAFIAAAYKNEIETLLRQQGRSMDGYGLPLPRKQKTKGYYHPIPETIDLSREKILPPRPDGIRTVSADPVALQAGRRVTPVLRDAQRITLSGMKVLDYHGVVVAGQQELGLSFIRLPEVKKAFWGEPESLLRKRIVSGKPPPLASTSRGADINVFVSIPIVMNDRLIGVVLVNRTPTDLWKALYAKRRDITYAVIVILGVTLVIATITSYTITQPIHALIRQARRLAEGDRHAAEPLKNPMTREIAILSESFANMAQTIEHRSEYIRQFAMHVSHEFKTPLTAIQGSVELLQEHLDTMPPEQRERFLNNIAQDTDRLKRLVSRLLELARADVLEPDAIRIDILPVLKSFVSRYQDFGLQIQLYNHTGQEPLKLAITPEALESVFSNLLDNSLQHGASRVAIEIRDCSERIEIRVADNGRGVSSANAEKLFTPFFTTHREHGGTGLGLSITQSLLNAYNGGIRLEPSDSGAVFVVFLPHAEETPA
jgi:signal transduction histidine kinase